MIFTNLFPQKLGPQPISAEEILGLRDFEKRLESSLANDECPFLCKLKDLNATHGSVGDYVSQHEMKW